MYNTRYAALPLLLLLGLCVPTVGRVAEEQCFKRVFDRYCLGGEISRLQREKPDYIRQQRENHRFALVYASGRERYYVMAYRDRIYKVLRQYSTASSKKYRELRDELTRRYGMPREMSSFPVYARGLATKIGAIRRGEGRALLEWRPASTPWRVELSWTVELGLSLAYIAAGENLIDVQSGGEY